MRDADPLTDVLRLSDARCEWSGGFTAGGRWGLRFPRFEKMTFAVLVKGACLLRIEGARRVLQICAGDVVLLSGQKGYDLLSDATIRPRDVQPLFDGSGFLRAGRGEDCVALTGGVYVRPASANLFVDVLPPLVLVRADAPTATALRWIVEQIAVERTSTLPGSAAATDQLAQLLFMQVLRAHIANSARAPAGWLRGIGDAQLVRALRVMHGDPARAWQLQELAEVASMSRTSFALHFKSVVGIAPLTYLTQWRMQLAVRALREGTPIADIAAAVGYASESAFSHAFKRVVGTTPRAARLAEAAV